MIGLENADADEFINLGVAPWFDVEWLSAVGFVYQYTVDGWLPGDTPLEWTKTCHWRHQCACLDTDLIRRRSMGFPTAYSDFFEKVLRDLECLPKKTMCTLAESMFVHLTAGETHFIDALHGIPTENIDTWRGTSCVDPSAWVWTVLSSGLTSLTCSKSDRVGMCSLRISGVFDPNTAAKSHINA